MAEKANADEDIWRAPCGRWEKIGYWVAILPGVPVLWFDDALAGLGLAASE